MTKRMLTVACPLCPMVIPHLCYQDVCTIDVGLYLAAHVGVAHPSLITSIDEMERRRLTANAQARRN